MNHDKLTERFNSRLSKMSRDGCWIWDGARTSGGYGCLLVGDKLMQAHRYAYWRATGQHPRRKKVCHRCDVKRCCNPKHLFLGTQLDNMRDCVRKGRFAVGERNNKTFLTTSDVRLLRRMYKQGWTQTQLAKRFALSSPGIHHIVTNRTWKHI